jgi:glyoxylase-like metal-dependent hydrolase (beta-lactamase superfamily II)
MRLKSILSLAAPIAMCTVALAQMDQSVILPENSAKRVSDHVYAIMGFPNIAIVVGDRATLVVDTGMGARNGQIIMRAVEKLSKNQVLYLTTTHFHPEHAAGEPGFPPRTILIRDTVQQQEMDANGRQMIEMFSKMSAQNKQLLDGVVLRKPDIIFDNELRLDLGGGVTARLLWFGPGHTKGDELIFVEPDSALISGDIVENKLVPAIYGEASTVKGWLAILDKVAPLNPRFVVPDHGELGDGSLIQKERAFIQDLQTQALQLKRKGVSAEEAGKMLTETLKSKYPDWPNLRGVPNVVQRVYAESN